MIIVESCFTNVLTSYIKSCYVFVKFRLANENYSPSKLASLSLLNGVLVIQMVSNSLNESKKKLLPFDEKNRDMGSEKYICNLFQNLFAKYLSYSEVQKNSKV